VTRVCGERAFLSEELKRRVRGGGGKVEGEMLRSTTSGELGAESRQRGW
jgi:hypothetical protein